MLSNIILKGSVFIFYNKSSSVDMMNVYTKFWILPFFKPSIKHSLYNNHDDKFSFFKCIILTFFHLTGSYLRFKAILRRKVLQGILIPVLNTWPKTYIKTKNRFL